MIQRAFSIDDPVIVTVGAMQTRSRGRILRVVDEGYYAVEVDGRELYRWGSELTPIEDAPEGVVVAALDEDPTPLLVMNETVDLGEVDAEDAPVGAAISACETIVRICDAAERLTLCERVTINGVTWLVQVAPETP